MKEEITGFVLKCNACGEYLEAPDGGPLVLSEDEIVPMCEAYDWKTTGATHYCDNCKERVRDEKIR